MKLDIQKFGGRGASSGGTKSIGGVPVVKNASGYKYWNIGRNAPDGYIGLIKGSGSNSQTAYIKSQYANEIANFRSAGSNAMNYDSISILNREITRLEKRIENTVGNLKERRQNDLKEMKRAREIRNKLGL